MIRKVRFFSIADFEEEELWLREQHRRGLRFVKCVPPCFYVFEACQPEDVVYRLDYKNAALGADYLQLFGDYGWEYIQTMFGWCYFRKSASLAQRENDAEIFSDPASKVDMIRHLFQTRMLPLLAIFLCCILPNWTRLVLNQAGRTEQILGMVFTGLLLLYSISAALLRHQAADAAQKVRKVLDGPLPCPGATPWRGKGPGGELTSRAHRGTLKVKKGRRRPLFGAAQRLASKRRSPGMNAAYQRAKALVAQMTLAEKCAQMRYDAPAIERLGVPAYNWWNEALHGGGPAPGAATVFPQAIGMRPASTPP